MRDPFESLIPLNGCKGTHFPVNHQIFLLIFYAIALNISLFGCFEEILGCIFLPS